MQKGRKYLCESKIPRFSFETTVIEVEIQSDGPELSPLAAAMHNWMVERLRSPHHDTLFGRAWKWPWPEQIEKASVQTVVRTEAHDTYLICNAASV